MFYCLNWGVGCLAFTCHHCIVLYDFLESFCSKAIQSMIQTQTTFSSRHGGWWTEDLSERNRPPWLGIRRKDTTPHGETEARTEKRRRQKTMECGTPRGGGGLPSFSSVWWSLDGFLLPDLHLPSRLKKFSSSSRPYSGPAGPPSDSFTALVNFTWNTQTQNT